MVQVSLAFGLAVFVGAQICGPISGGYMNPAVVIGGLVARRLSVIRSILFVAFQIIGAIGLYTVIIYTVVVTTNYCMLLFNMIWL